MELKEKLYTLIRELCLIPGVSGDTQAVRDYIIDKIKGKCEFVTDNLGNIVGKKGDGGNIYIDAHTDEVGLIATAICDNGFVRVAQVGGIDDRILPATRLVCGDVHGVTSCKPIHLMEKDEHEKAQSEDNIAVDIGADSREEAEKLVQPGATFAFERMVERFGHDGDFVCSPALDDRAGCAIIILLITETDLNFRFSFSDLEEIGCHGAGSASFSIPAEYAIAIETTTASDIPDVSPDKDVCRVNEGAVVSFKDRSTLYDRREYYGLLELAKRNGIAAQPKRAVAGGNNMGSIHKAGTGKRAMAISLPARYLHSPAVVISLRDAVSVYELVKARIAENK